MIIETVDKLAGIAPPNIKKTLNGYFVNALHARAEIERLNGLLSKTGNTDKCTPTKIRSSMRIMDLNREIDRLHGFLEAKGVSHAPAISIGASAPTPEAKSQAPITSNIPNGPAPAAVKQHAAILSPLPDNVTTAEAMQNAATAMVTGLTGVSADTSALGSDVHAALASSGSKSVAEHNLKTKRARLSENLSCLKGIDRECTVAQISKIDGQISKLNFPKK